MTGREFVMALEKEGFVVRRRASRFVWLARGEETLLLDESATLPTGFLDRLLGRRRRRRVVGASRDPSALGALNALPRSAAKA